MGQVKAFADPRINDFDSEKLTSSAKPLESNLHRNMIEHINSEIALKTINSFDSALHWLRSSFLYVRIAENPLHYGISDANEESANQVSLSVIYLVLHSIKLQRLEEFVMKNITTLAGDNIISSTETGDALQSTVYGDIMVSISSCCARFHKLENL